MKTKDRITFLELDGLCIFCKADMETFEHLFFDCSLTCKVWFSIKDWIGLKRNMSTFKSSRKRLKNESNGNSRQARSKRTALAATIYFLWNSSNRFIFKGELFAFDNITMRIKAKLAFWLSWLWFVQVLRLVCVFVPFSIRCSS